MKEKICLFTFLLVCCLLYGCRIDASLSKVPDGGESVAVSNDCALCGKRSDSLMGYYRRFDSIGVICLNKWGISDSQVRR